jgi:hypothetical protein
LCSICLWTGLYNPSLLPALKNLAPEISYFAAFLRRSPLPTSNSFSMAAVDLNHVQFWAPPSNSFLYKRRTTSLQSKGRFICTNSYKTVSIYRNVGTYRTAFLPVIAKSLVACPMISYSEGPSHLMNVRKTQCVFFISNCGRSSLFVHRFSYSHILLYSIPCQFHVILQRVFTAWRCRDLFWLLGAASTHFNNTPNVSTGSRNFMVVPLL